MPIVAIIIMAVVLPLASAALFTLLVVLFWGSIAAFGVWLLYWLIKYVYTQWQIEAKSPQPKLPELSQDEYAKRRIAVLEAIEARIGLSQEEQDELRALRIRLGMPT